MSRVHIAPKCDTALPWVHSNTPATREVDWMNGSRHNKNASRQTDRRTEIPAFIREKNMFRPLPPKLRICDVDLYRSFEAQKMVFGPALVIILYIKCGHQGAAINMLGIETAFKCMIVFYFHFRDSRSHKLCLYYGGQYLPHILHDQMLVSGAQDL